MLAKIELGSLVVIFIFVVLPILQSVLAKKKKKKQAGQQPRTRRRPLATRPTTQAPTAPPGIPATPAAPTTTTTPTMGEEPETSGQEMWKQLLEGMGFEEEPAPEPEPIPVPPPKRRALAPLSVHLPSETIVTGPRQLGDLARTSIDLGPPDPDRPTVSFEPPRGALDWRRAVVLSEILGPPVCERAPGGAGAPPGLTR